MSAEHARILALHAFYQVPGGEDVSHRSEVAYLRERGHQVLDITADNAALGTLGTVARARATVSNPESARRVSAAIAEFRPDVAYANNLFPGLSGSVVRACRDAGVPVVRVLRNYRFTCVSGNLYRDGNYCDDCVGNAGVAGVVHGCYRGSRPTSAIATVARRADLAANRDTQWIAVSRYVRDHAVRAGLPADRVAVRSNLALPAAIDQPLPAQIAADAGAPRVLYVGRDSREKGLPLLLDAFAALRARVPEARLWVAGAERDEATDGVTWLGQLPHSAVGALMARADVLAVPSVWPEPFGRVVIEALAVGTPVVAVGSGGLAELAGPAVHTVSRADAPLLAASLLEAIEAPRERARTTALERFAADFSPDVWYRRTVEALERARAG